MNNTIDPKEHEERIGDRSIRCVLCGETTADREMSFGRCDCSDTDIRIWKIEKSISQILKILTENKKHEHH